MRIGMDISAVRHGLTNGVAVYTANLARALLDLPEVELIPWFCARPSASAENFLGELRSLGARIESAPAPWGWSPDGAWWLPVRPPISDIMAGVDVFHVGEFHLPHALGPGGPAYVATVHDLTTVTHSKYHTSVNRRVHRRRLEWIRRNAHHLIAVSESTARDLELEGGIEAGRIAIVHEARSYGLVPSGDPEIIRENYGIAKRFILTVGTLEPRKNLKRLIQAFEGLAKDDDVELVLVGGKGWRSGAIQRAIQTSPARSRIRHLGSVSSRDLAALYAAATVFAYPSLYEGFGLPVLEAMAAGVPVLASNISSIPEVAGDAALLVDPGSVSDIRNGLSLLMDDGELRARLSLAGRQREQVFSWERAARETLAVYRMAMEQKADDSRCRIRRKQPTKGSSGRP